MALVIGIGNYVHAPELINPPTDARAIADRFRGLGFEVDLQLDLDNRELVGALRDFGIRAAAADVAVIYYAGHGVQVDGVNYLVPADARLERVRDLLYEAMPLQLFLGELAGAGKLGIMILDACRDNPFVERLTASLGASRTNEISAGLGRVDDTPSDTLVAMSTRANAVAEDGAGEHSPYAEALLEELQVPGLELGLFFRRVRDRVLQTTQGRQEPFTFGSLGATPFYFNPRPPNRPPVVAELGTLTVLDNAAATPLEIAAPTDPDGDQLVVQVAGLPRGGSLLIGDRTALIGDYLTVEQLRSTAFRPDGSLRGDAGSFDYAVSDGQGGLTRGAVRVAIEASNRPPVMPAELALQAVVNRIEVPAPADPDGDSLTVRVRTVPDAGKVRLGGETLTPGDLVAVERLSEITYDPEDAAVGSTQTLVLVTGDGRGGEAVTTVKISLVGSMGETVVTAAATTPEPPPAVAVATAPEPTVQVPEPPAAASAPEPEPEPVMAAEPAPLIVAGLTLEPAQGSFVASTDSNLRREPSASSARVGRITKGTTLTALGRAPGSNWYFVQPPEGEPAFIHGDLLVPGEPAPPAPSPAAVELAEAERAPAPAETKTALLARSHGGFQDCPSCPVLARIEPGSFMMGSRADISEQPVRRIVIERPFALGRFEVTVAEWRACVDAGACERMPRIQSPEDTMPVHNVHWLEVMDYLAWLSEQAGQSYRLPSEAEWEYAARAGSDDAYWWGDKIDGSKVICKDCGGTGFDRLRPPLVDARPANPFGLYGMSGGVAEWLADCWVNDYADAPAGAAPRDAPNCRRRVLRGGSWRDEPTYLRASARNFYDIDVRYLTNGFRVARDLE